MNRRPHAGRIVVYTLEVCLSIVLVAMIGGSRLADGIKVLDSPRSSPMVGIVGASGRYYSEEHAAGVEAVTLGVSWNDAEPTPDGFSNAYGASIRSRIAAGRAAGLKVVLDPGVQYAPNWVFSLPGGTRFVNQFGAAFGGAPGSGDEVPNGVTDGSVRNAESRYFAWLGAQIPGGEVIAVRQGGGPFGELRYPDPDFRGHTDSFWAYDASTQATSPVPGWKPGTGTPAQAREFLDAYNQALDSYGAWLNGQMEADFHTELLVMLPGWGERPESVAPEVASRLTLNLPEFNEGLDWTDLLRSLPDPSDSVAYTTYLDAPSFGTTTQLEDPADYIASLVAGTRILLGGENTGDGTVASLGLCIDRARVLGYYIMQWMDESQLVGSGVGRDPAGPTIQQLGAAGG